MNKFHATALATAFVATTAFAAPETFEIDPGHTLPRFEYSHFGFSTQVHPLRQGPAARSSSTARHARAQ